MLRWSQVLAYQQRYEDLRAEAESERLARQLLAGCNSRGRFDDRVLALLGRSLVTLGYRLQKQRGTAGRTCTVRGVEHLQQAAD